MDKFLNTRRFAFLLYFSVLFIASTVTDALFAKPSVYKFGFSEKTPVMTNYKSWKFTEKPISRQDKGRIASEAEVQKWMGQGKSKLIEKLIERLAQEGGASLIEAQEASRKAAVVSRQKNTRPLKPIEEQSINTLDEIAKLVSKAVVGLAAAEEAAKKEEFNFFKEAPTYKRMSHRFDSEQEARIAVEKGITDFAADVHARNSNKDLPERLADEVRSRKKAEAMARSLAMEAESARMGVGVVADKLAGAEFYRKQVENKAFRLAEDAEASKRQFSRLRNSSNSPLPAHFNSSFGHVSKKLYRDLLNSEVVKRKAAEAEKGNLTMQLNQVKAQSVGYYKRSLLNIAQEKFPEVNFGRIEKQLFSSLEKGIIANFTEEKIPPVIKARLIEWLYTSPIVREKFTRNGLSIKGAVVQGELGIQQKELPFPLNLQGCVISTSDKYPNLVMNPIDSRRSYLMGKYIEEKKKSEEAMEKLSEALKARKLTEEKIASIVEESSIRISQVEKDANLSVEKAEINLLEQLKNRENVEKEVVLLQEKIKKVKLETTDILRLVMKKVDERISKELAARQEILKKYKLLFVAMKKTRSQAENDVIAVKEKAKEEIEKMEASKKKVEGKVSLAVSRIQKIKVLANEKIVGLLSEMEAAKMLASASARLAAKEGAARVLAEEQYSQLVAKIETEKASVEKAKAMAKIEAGKLAAKKEAKRVSMERAAKRIEEEKMRKLAEKSRAQAKRARELAKAEKEKAKALAVVQARKEVERIAVAAGLAKKIREEKAKALAVVQAREEATRIATEIELAKKIEEEKAKALAEVEAREEATRIATEIELAKKIEEEKAKALAEVEAREEATRIA
ncbi:MAG: hypothetical protein ACI8RA_002068, partial [Chlamydiales bacterium]